MTGVTWRKGLFRLWALLAILWIFVVLAFVSFTGDLNEKWKELGRAAAWERMIIRVENGIDSGGMTNNDGEFINADQLQSDLVGIKERQVGIVEQTSNAKEWFFGLLGFLLVPTLGLLLIGRAGVWVADGFRSNLSQ